MMRQKFRTRRGKKKKKSLRGSGAMDFKDAFLKGGGTCYKRDVWLKTL